MVDYKLVTIISSSKNMIEEYPQDSESMEDSVSLWMANIIAFCSGAKDDMIDCDS